MNDYLIMPIILVMIVIFFLNFLILDEKFEKVYREFHKKSMEDMNLKYKLESMERQLDRLNDEVRRK